LKAAWEAANLGLEPAALDRAIAGAAGRAKAALTDPEQKRWGQYSIQRVFLNFLEQAGVREELVPGGRGEVVFYNLGKFSQVISDFETIHFQSKPVEKYARSRTSFSTGRRGRLPGGLAGQPVRQPRRRADHDHPPGQRDAVAGRVRPRAAQEPLPAKKPGGATSGTSCPGPASRTGALRGHDRGRAPPLLRRHDAQPEVPAPDLGANPRQETVPEGSEFWNDILVSKYVKRRPPDYSAAAAPPAEPRAGVANVVFSFSDLKYFFECPYQFKLRILYGFNAPIHEALGYGKSLHDALAEVHARAIRGDVADAGGGAAPRRDAPARALRLPGARQQLEQRPSACCATTSRQRRLFDKIEFSEKQIEIDLGDGVTVNGRIDLVRRIDTGETTIVDLKSSDRAQAEDVTETQLHVYALGYQDLTGRRPDYVEIYELDEASGSHARWTTTSSPT
jgi:DNA helicase II / ATP-dependent DNA helicase PcrA